MTREIRLRRVWWFTLAMCFISVSSFVVGPGHVYDPHEVALLINALVWGFYSTVLRAEIARLSYLEVPPTQKPTHPR